MDTSGRPYALAYPSPTPSRFVLLLAALLSAGAFAGSQAYDRLHGAWLTVVPRCESEARERAAALTPAGRRELAGPGPVTISGTEGQAGRYEAAMAEHALAGRCLEPHRRREAGYAFAGAAGAGMAGLAVLLLAPAVIERRRRLRRLGPVLPQAAARVAELAAESGMTRVPVVFLGAATLRDGYGYGRPGRYRIVLPQAVAVRWRSRDLFDPLVRHELAHIVHGDVTLAWLARSLGYVVAPMLVLPLVVIALSGDRGLLPGFLWRVVLLGATTALVSRALLRSREHDADLRAARAGGGPEGFTAILGRARASDALSWHRRLLAFHPSPARRRAVLARPELATGVTFLDGFAGAFLAALTIPLLTSGLTGLLFASGRTDLAVAAAAVLMGLLLGGSVGLGLWRSALLYRTASVQRAAARWPGPPHAQGAAHGQVPAGETGGPWPAPGGGAGRSWPAAGGVAAGLVAGQLASLAQTDGNPSWTIVLVAWAGLGATSLAAGLGELWADAAPAMARRASWMIALAVNWALFAVALWFGSQLNVLLDVGGWEITRWWMANMPLTWPATAAVAAPAAAATWALFTARRGGVTPAWLLESGEPRPWQAPGQAGSRGIVPIAVFAALAGIVAMLVFRLVMGPAGSDAVRLQRFFLSMWVCAAVVVAAALVIALASPRRGLGAALFAGPLAGLVAGAGYIGVDGLFGGRPTLVLVAEVVPRPLLIGFVLILFAAPAGLLIRRRGPGPRRRGRLGWWPAAAVLGLVAAGTVIAARVPLTGSGGPVPSPPGGTATRAEASYYIHDLAPELVSRFQDVRTARAGIDADPDADGKAKAARMRTEVLVPLRALLADAQAYRPVGVETRAAHRDWVALVQAETGAFELLATAWETGDEAASREAAVREQEALRHLTAWGEKVTGDCATCLPTVAGGG